MPSVMQHMNTGGIRFLSSKKEGELCLFFCETLQKEITYIYGSLSVPKGTKLFFYPHFCTAGKSKIDYLKTYFSAYVNPENSGLLFGDVAISKRDILPSNIIHTGPDTCHALVAPVELIHDFAKKGSYFIFPGWLLNWEEYVTGMGFDPSIPTTFFSSSLNGITLLDTGVIPIPEDIIRSFETFAGLHLTILKTGTSYLTAIIEAAICKWRMKQIKDSSTIEDQSVLQSSATQMAVMALISEIASVSEEPEVISRIFIMIQSLFAPEKIEYIPYFSTGPGEISIFPSGEKISEYKSLLIGFERDYYLLDNNEGFVVSIRHKKTTLGVLGIFGVSVPDRIREYLNLTLSMTSFLGLAINNSRLWGEIQKITSELEAANDKLRDNNEELLSLTHELQGSNHELIKSQKELADSEEFIKTIVNSANIGIMVLDKDARVLFYNPEMERIFGLKGEPMKGNVVFEFFPHLDKNGPFPYFFNAISGEKIVAPDLEFHLPSRDYSTWISSIFVPVYDKENSIIGVTNYVFDITERKKSEKELMRAYEALKVSQNKLAILSSVTRHDILNKVMVIYGYSEILLAATSNEIEEKSLKNILTAGNDIKNLISFTKEYQELGVQNPIWIQIGEVMSKPSIKCVLNGIELLLLDIPIEIYVDPMFEKVMYNLIDNSHRHGQNVSKITISARQSGDDYLIDYVDNGVGVPNEEKKVIFKQGHGKNTGMGLFLIREILDITKISICECGLPGEGVRFEMVVPKDSWRKISQE